MQDAYFTHCVKIQSIIQLFITVQLATNVPTGSNVLNLILLSVGLDVIDETIGTGVMTRGRSVPSQFRLNDLGQLLP